MLNEKQRREKYEKQELYIHPETKSMRIILKCQSITVIPQRNTCSVYI